MKLKSIEEYLFNKGFILEESYKGNVHYCSIYVLEDEKIHIWYDVFKNVHTDCIYKETFKIKKDISCLPREYNLIEEIRDFKIKNLIKKEDSSLLKQRKLSTTKPNLED